MLAVKEYWRVVFIENELRNTRYFTSSNDAENFIEHLRQSRIKILRIQNFTDCD